MELTTGQMALIFAGCTLVIGVVVILWKRGMFGGKAAAVTPAPTNSEPAK